MQQPINKSKLLTGKALEWVLTLLVSQGGYRDFLYPYNFQDDDLAIALGLEKWIDRKNYKENKILKKLKKKYQLIKKTQIEKSEIDITIEHNINMVSEYIDLDEVSKSILGFITHAYNNRFLEQTCRYLDDVSTQDLFRLLALLLGITEEEVSACFGQTGQLERSGLVALNKHKDDYLHHKFDFVSDRFCYGLSQPGISIKELLVDILSISPKAQLALSDYSYSGQVGVLSTYLKNAFQQKRKGVNAFVYGYPGTGKTQLARVLAANIGCNAYEVCYEDSAGDPIDGVHRLKALALGQRVLAQSGSLLVFDEAENVFNDGGIFQESTAKRHKAWLNRTLEETPVPVIWLSNSCHIDAAFLRRFDMVIHLDVPPKSQREKLLAKICKDHVDAKALNYLAKSDHLSPAVMQRAVDVGIALKDKFTDQQLPKVVGDIVCSTLKAQGVSVPKPDRSGRLDLGFDPELLSSSLDLGELYKGLTQSQSARICLYGPPGTGKTEFGRWLAKQLDKKLLLKKASDLLGKYVGESEQNIAAAFAEAEELEAVLQIDEVDSFLRERHYASKSWETTLVNEMLTQMEAFSGIMIASTNLMEGLDQAALRRFDLKLELGYLRPQACRVMLQKACEHMGLAVSDNCAFDAIVRLDTLTPGDFAAVVRQAKFNPVNDASQLVAMLAQECQLKQGSQQTIGFIH